MFKIIDTDGRMQECEGLDINVWLDEEGNRVNLTAYKMEKDENDLWRTNTNVCLFWANTNFSAEDYADEWYGYSDDTVPGDMPTEVRDLVNQIVKEVSL